MKKEVLQQLGLSEKEVDVYIATVKVGPAPVSKIAREASLPRQTAYSLLSDMLIEGYVEQSDKAGVKQFFAEPEKLFLLLDRKQSDIEKQKKDLEKELPKLNALKGGAMRIPEVRYYEGDEGVKGQFDDILAQYKKGTTKKFRGYGVNSFKEALGEYLYGFVRERYKAGVETNLVIAEGPDDFGITGEENRYGRDIKRIDMKPKEAGVYLVGDRAYLFSYKDKVGIMIQNEAILDLLKDAFDDHWEKIK